METMDEQGDTGSQEGMEIAPWEIELPDEGVVSQEETESQDETESQEEAESQEETKSQDEMEPQMETPNNLHWNWADEVEDMVDRQIDKKLELWEKCCREAGQVKCCHCQRAGHCARECDAKVFKEGTEEAGITRGSRWTSCWRTGFWRVLNWKGRSIGRSQISNLKFVSTRKRTYKGEPVKCE